MFKKKEIIIPIWDREEEYQRTYSRMIAAEELYRNYAGDDEKEEEKLKSEWVELKKLFEPLYAQREDWLDKSGTRECKEKKEKTSRDTKVAAAVTLFGIALPPIIENRGIIIKGIKDWVQKPRLWRK